MSNFKKTPPDLKKCSTYEDYKKMLELWSSFTSIDKKEQGTAVLLSLEGKAQESVLELSKDEITADDGLSKVLAKLDKIYLKDTLIKKYEALDSFENYRRPSDVSVSDYIHEFDKRYTKTKSLGTTMSDDLLAYRLLVNANLGEQYTKLVKATAELNFENMKSKLKNLFSEAGLCAEGSTSSSSFSSSGSLVPIKQEVDTFHCKSNDAEYHTYCSK